MRRILVLRGGALGDFIVTLPALAGLRQQWPEARIELAGNATAAALAQARGLLDAVHSQQEARWAELFSSAPLSPSFATWLAEFDLVLCFWPDPDGELAGRFPLHARQQYIHGAAWPVTAPAARHFISGLSPLGISGYLPPFFGAQPRVSAERAPSKPMRQVALHPGSGSPRKNWPVEKWRELAGWLSAQSGLSLAIISGPAEPEPPLSEFGVTWRDLPLEALVDRLSRCALFVGHDSGISHLASACGAPCVLMFGPTDPAIWAPPGPNVAVVQAGPDLASLPLASVQAAIRAALS